MAVVASPIGERIDVAALKARIDLIELIGRDTALRKVAGTRGGEYAGPCPFCGGRDRLRVQPAQGLWWCRSCSDQEHWQDAIAYAQQRESLDFVQACESLGGVSLHAGAINVRPRPVVQPDPEPSPTWRARGMALVEQCEAALWSDVGERARVYLHGRGLTDETLRAWRLGFQPQERRFEPAKRWGLLAVTEDGRPAFVHVPRGITLPWLAGGELWQIKVRTSSSDPKRRYQAVRGGHPLLFGADTLEGQRVAALTEGEFDAMLLHQEAGDLLGVATLGSCSRSLGGHALSYLLPLHRVLVAYDTDEDGQRGAERLLAVSARMHRAAVPVGKDVTEFWRQGGRLGDWVRFELARVGATT